MGIPTPIRRAPRATFRRNRGKGSEREAAACHSPPAVSGDVAALRCGRGLRVTLVALGVALLTACGQTIESYPCPPGSTLTYQNFGAAFMRLQCLSCHGEASRDRAGAPGEFNFDTLEQIQRHTARIFVRAAASNDSMPPGPGDPPLEERNRLAEWLACGARP